MPGEMANQLMECPSCKQTIEIPVRSHSQTPEVASFTASPSEGESIFFKDGDIMVTNARFVVGAKTFAMRGITSVEVVEAEEIVETRTGNPLPGVIIGAGLIIIAVGFLCWLLYDWSLWVLVGAGIVGVMMFIGAGSLLTQPKRVFKIVLKTAGGEVIAYKSFDRSHISQIIRALNDSIIAHG
jgi:hypothetical protein